MFRARCNPSEEGMIMMKSLTIRLLTATSLLLGAEGSAALEFESRAGEPRVLALSELTAH